MKKKVPNFFQQELSEAVERARAYGTGKSIATLAAETDTVSLSTMKKIVRGENIRVPQLKAVREVFSMSPLDWIEVKIRFGEAYLQEYLVKDTAFSMKTQLEKLGVEEFFATRAEQKNLWETRRDRLNFFVETHFRKRKMVPEDIADPVGESGKKDKFTVSRPTAGAFKRGDHVKPEKFKLVCRRLKIEGIDRTIAKVLYSEAYLNEFLLGEDSTVFKALTLADYPRTAALLIYSSKNAETLA